MGKTGLGMRADRKEKTGLGVAGRSGKRNPKTRHLAEQLIKRQLFHLFTYSISIYLMALYL